MINNFFKNDFHTSKNVYILFDGDESGQKASLRCGYILAGNAVEAKIIIPPDNLDPDDWARQDDGKEILESIDEAKDVITTHYTLFSKKKSEGSLSINEFIQECLEELINVDDIIIREIMIKRISELTRIDHNNNLKVLNEKLSKRKNFTKNKTYYDISFNTR